MPALQQPLQWQRSCTPLGHCWEMKRGIVMTHIAGHMHEGFVLAHVNVHVCKCV